MVTSQSIIPQSDDRLFTYFLTEALKYFTEYGGKTERDKRDNIIPFILLGLIAVVGTEPLKILLRKNIGKLSLSMPRLITACILYWIFATLFFLAGNKYSEFTSAFYAGGFFYSLFGLFILILGKREYDKSLSVYISNYNDTLLNLFRGESVFFFPAGTWTQEKIWLKKEPIICFVIGLILTVLPVFIDPMLCFIGAPFLMTASSFWFNEWFQVNNVWASQIKKIEKEEQKISEKQRLFDDNRFRPVSNN